MHIPKYEFKLKISAAKLNNSHFNPHGSTWAQWALTSWRSITAWFIKSSSFRLKLLARALLLILCSFFLDTSVCVDDVWSSSAGFWMLIVRPKQFEMALKTKWDGVNCKLDVDTEIGYVKSYLIEAHCVISHSDVDNVKYENFIASPLLYKMYWLAMRTFRAYLGIYAHKSARFCAQILTQCLQLQR